MGFLLLSTEVQNIVPVVGIWFAFGKENIQEYFHMLFKKGMTLY